MAKELYELADKCPHCGTGHIAGPHREDSCTCRCRACDKPMNHLRAVRFAGKPEHLHPTTSR